MSAAVVADQVIEDPVVGFVYDEAELLDSRRLHDWLALFAPDGLLWVPGRADGADPRRHVSIIYDRLPQLQARVTRLLSGKETAQDPPSRTVRSITNVRRRAADESGVVVVDCVQVIYETRGLDRPLLVLPCRVSYRLRPAAEAEPTDSFAAAEGPGWRIVEKRIDLLEIHRHFENLAFLL